MTIAPFRTQGGTDTQDVVFADSNTAISGAANAINITAGSSTWTFDAAGSLTVPGTDGSIVAPQDWTLGSNTFGNIRINNANVVFDGSVGGFITTMQTDPNVYWSWFNQSVGDAAGNTYGAGLDNYGGFIPYLAKLDSTGNALWQREITIDGSEAINGTAVSVAMDASGNPLFVGRDYWTGNNGFWYQSVDATTGDTLTNTNVRDSESDNMVPAQIAAMPNGNVEWWDIGTTATSTMTWATVLWAAPTIISRLIPRCSAATSRRSPAIGSSTPRHWATWR